MKLTKRGWQLCALGVIAAVVGRTLALIELIVIGVALLTLVGVSAVWVVRTRLRLRLQRSVNPTRVHAGEPAVVTLRMTNLGRRTPTLTVTDFVTGTSGVMLSVGQLRTGTNSEGSYRLPTKHRGLLRIGPAEVSIRDPLAIAELSRTVGESTKFIVYPPIIRLPAKTLAAGSGALTTSGKSHSLHRVGEDFYALRDYTVGDDPRRIHWRSTARLGRTMVREGEISHQNQLSVMLDTRTSSYDGGSPNAAGSSNGAGSSSAAGSANAAGSASGSYRTSRDTDWARAFDIAVTIAASVITAALQQGDAVRLVTTSGGVVGIAPTAHSAGEIFTHLAEVSPTDFGALRPTLNHLGVQGSGAVVAIMGPQPPDQATDLAALANLSRQVGSLIMLRAGVTDSSSGGTAGTGTTSTGAAGTGAAGIGATGTGVAGTGTASPTAASPGTASPGTASTGAGGMTLVDVADLSQLPSAWETACARAAGRRGTRSVTRTLSTISNSPISNSTASGNVAT